MTEPYVPTRLEYFAGLAMQAIIANTTMTKEVLAPRFVAEQAVSQAKQMIYFIDNQN